MRATTRRVLVVTGATASCKTAASSILHTLLPSSSLPTPRVVSVDAVQVFDGPSIGAASPTQEELEATPTAGIGILPLSSLGSAGEVAAMAYDVVEKQLDAGAVPIVVGGSGLYVDWLVHGAQGDPKACPQVRKEVEQEVGDNPEWNEWVDVAAKVMPMRTSRIEPNDWVKLRRLLEIVRQVGEPAAGRLDDGNAGRVSLGEALDADVRVINLYWPRMAHLRAVDARVEDMFAQGLLPEIIDLYAGSHVSPSYAGSPLNLSHTGPPLTGRSHPVARAIGYAQTIPFLAEMAADPGARSDTGWARRLLKVVRDVQAKSRQLTRKQNRWFSNPSTLWVPLEGRPLPDVAQQVARLVVDTPRDEFDLLLEQQEPVWKASPDELAQLRTYIPEYKMFDKLETGAMFAQAAKNRIKAVDAALDASGAPALATLMS